MTDSVDTIILKNKAGLNEKNIKTLRDFDRFNRTKNLAECTRYNQTLLLMKFIARTNKNFTSKYNSKSLLKQMETRFKTKNKV